MGILAPGDAARIGGALSIVSLVFGFLNFRWRMDTIEMHADQEFFFYEYNNGTVPPHVSARDAYFLTQAYIGVIDGAFGMVVGIAGIAACSMALKWPAFLMALCGPEARHKTMSMVATVLAIGSAVPWAVGFIYIMSIMGSIRLQCSIICPTEAFIRAINVVVFLIGLSLDVCLAVCLCLVWKGADGEGKKPVDENTPIAGTTA